MVDLFFAISLIPCAIVLYTQKIIRNFQPEFQIMGECKCFLFECRPFLIARMLRSCEICDDEFTLALGYSILPNCLEGFCAHPKK